MKKTFLIFALGLIAAACYKVPLSSEHMKFIHLPNTFSPNGDGINDIFGPVYSDTLLTSEITFFEMLIFSPEKEILFETTDPDEEWNGTDKDGDPMPPGDYLFRMDVVFADGDEGERYGSVSLYYP